MQVNWGGEDVELDPKEAGKLVTGSNRFVYLELDMFTTCLFFHNTCLHINIHPHNVQISLAFAAI